MKVVSTICPVFNDVLFEKMVKSSWYSKQMTGLSSKDQAGAWHMISVNTNRQRSADMSVIVEKTVQSCSRAHIRLSFSLSKKRDPGMCLTWNCLGMCVMVVIWARLVDADWLFKSKRSWRSEERCTAVLFGAVLWWPGDGCTWDIHREWYQTLTGRTSSRR